LSRAIACPEPATHHAIGLSSSSSDSAQKQTGMIAKLDEECLRPGDPTALTLLEKFNAHFGNHKHYVSRATSRSDKTLGVHDFRLKHYAGDVRRAEFGPVCVMAPSA